MLTKRLLLLSLVFLVACKSPTPDEHMDSILSWIATAGLAGDAWLHHTTPDTYTRQTLELSSKKVSRISSDLLESPPPGVDRAALDSALTGGRRRIERLAALIRAKDAPQFARVLDSLRTDQRAVKVFADRIESSQ